ncbi:hypothetical protein DL764_000681 [Monosporascus ibericus]|uniref:Heme haloperoxidase family profile domain-containing protein n=1 Tax=Monosporascus ibericus TaxID=155417 RepID=A0A4Q4TUJ0_9PEZI|nr:hypothetical protein DL764_000681 [Monosporascus ibericus]
MLNTLANHGFLPYDGEDITEEDTVHALGEGLNFDEELSRLMHQFAVTTNPTPNATTYSLDHLGRHNILEHNTSLSHADACFDDPSIFSQTVFDETRSYWKGLVVDLDEAAISRLARLEISQATNPNYTLTAYLTVFGGYFAAAPKKHLEYFFQNERLPEVLGWKQPSKPWARSELLHMMQRVINATEAVSEGSSKFVVRTGMAAMHGGF